MIGMECGNWKHDECMEWWSGSDTGMVPVEYSHWMEHCHSTLPFLIISGKPS